MSAVLFAEENKLEFTEDGFIPAEILFKTVDSGDITISPNGRYIAGNRWYKRRKCSWGKNTFTYDVDNRTIRNIDDDVRHGIYWLAFSSDNTLIAESNSYYLYRLNMAEKDPEMLVAGLRSNSLG